MSKRKHLVIELILLVILLIAIAFYLQRRSGAVSKMWNWIIVHRKKSAIMLVIIFSILGLSWIAYLFLEAKIENNKYQLTTVVDNVTSTGIQLTVIAPEKKDRDTVYWDKVGSLHWDVGPYIVERASLLGWKEPKYTPHNQMSLAVYQSVAGANEFEKNWEALYGKLPNGVYRIGLGMKNRHDERVAMCYTTFVISEPDNVGFFDSIYWEFALILFVALAAVGTAWSYKRRHAEK